MDGKTALVTGPADVLINNAAVAAAISVSDLAGANLSFLPRSDPADWCGLIRRR